MLDRDQKILSYLKRFRVLSRDQVAALICPEVTRPWATVNRVMKRLHRDGWVFQIPRPREMQYLYMPNPTVIHPQSSKLLHFLGLTDLYLQLNRPDVYEVEPNVSENYRPDVYTRIDGTPIVIEYQRSTVSSKKMQEKVDLFVESFIRKQHDSRVLWIVSERPYRVKVPSGFTVEHKKTALT